MNENVLKIVLETLKDKDKRIAERVCVQKPIGCGEKVTGFRDRLSEREYGISGLCQKCQDRIFGEF